MIPFSEIVFGLGGILLRIFAMLLLIGAVYCVIGAFSRKHAIGYKAIAAVQLILVLCWLCLLLDGSFYVDYFDRVRAYPALAEWICRAPWIVVLAVDLLFAVILGLVLYGDRRLSGRELSTGSVKETMDLLPVAVCFGSEDGVVMLKNLEADRLNYEITGKPLYSVNGFWDVIDARGERQDDARIVVFPDGEAVLFRRDEIMTDGTPYIQITGGDVTDRYRITADLKEKNQRLIEIRTRMKEFGRKAQELATAEEFLHARVAVHDEMGHLLLSGKNYLDNPDTVDREKLLEMERYTHLLLMNEGEGSKEDVDTIGSAILSVQPMGVTVRLSGEPPQDKSLCEMLARAIRECAANTAKHAAGDMLNVTITQAGGTVSAVLCGNGDPPEKPITESGGLKLLRHSVEAAAGTMTVTSEPNVTVRITLPER